MNNKAEVREWEDKWVNNLHTDNINWGKIWQNQNNHIHNPRTKSALWEMIHLNFWSGFKAGERCHLCNVVEDDSFHIINKCSILMEVMRTFQLQDKYNNNLTISFGLDNDHITNFIFFHIKTVVFRSRFQYFSSKELCRTILIRKCKNRIKKDLQKRFYIYKLKDKVDDFTQTFIHYNRNTSDNDINNINNNNNNKPSLPGPRLSIFLYLC